MAEFRYVARNTSGESVKGKVEGADRNVAADILLKRGLFPVNIEEIIHSKSDAIDFSSVGELFSRKIKSDDLIVFSRQMYSLSKAGIPILRAINGLAESTRSVRFRQILEEVVEQLEQGRPLSVAFSQHPKVFSELVISIVNVGENTGRLDEAFLQLAEYFEREQETRQQVKSAIRYPMFVVIFVVAALFILNIYVIPQFATLFSKFGVELPALTKVLLAMSSFFVNYWKLMLLGIAALIVGWLQYLRTEKGRTLWDCKKLNIPIIGSIIERSTLARYARSFALMMRSGVPITTSLSLVAGAVGNYYMAQKIIEMRRNVERGESLLRTSTSSGLFTPLVLQMVAVGEETGNIDELLQNVAEYYEREVDYDLKSLTANIEPILISFVSVLVLVLALGIFTPMWDMYSVMQK